MCKGKLLIFSFGLYVLSFSHAAWAIWFEASGQAVIHNGDKKSARQLATQEAIKQALLFSGASVNSIQSLANGLLEDDRFEIRASGEVNDIQLIVGVWAMFRTINDSVRSKIKALCIPMTI